MDANLNNNPDTAADLNNGVATNSEAVPEKTGPRYVDLDAELSAMEADGISHVPAFLRAVRAKLGL